MKKKDLSLQEICRDFGFLQLVATFHYKIQSLFCNVKHFVACFTDLKEFLSDWKVTIIYCCLATVS